MIASVIGRMLLALYIGVFFGACRGEPRAPRPSVVLVLVDQLRKDAADRWLGETRALAERGVRFEEMRAVAPWTYPSVISLFSGLYPRQHGAGAPPTGRLLSIFSEAVPLLPRTLRTAGYYTAGFVTNPFLHEWNPFYRTFDHYDASFIGNQGPTRGYPKLVWTARMYADSVNPAVRAHFDARALQGPEFVYVHYIDVHGRAEGPERWKDAPFEGSYESAVRYVDGKIRELYDYFSVRYGGDFLFLVTSDHGQDLADDTQIGEGTPWRLRKASLHDFNLRIPLYVLPSKRVVSPRVIAEPCANIDVAPTLLEWLGLATLADAPGRSLLGAIRGQTYDGRERVLYAINSAYGRLEEATVHGGHKFMRYSRPLRARRLFDLEADPRELRPLLQDDSAEEALLEAAAGPGVLAFPAVFEAVSPGLRAHLEALGYVSDGEKDAKATE
jgi:arylsulfatase A-like enzyme